MAIGMLLHGVWFFASNLLLAINAHAALSKILFPTAVAAVFLAIPLGASLGLDGIAIATILSEMVCVVAALMFFQRIVVNPRSIST
jgi:O-antigen/teichoic acid export membrane protein